MKITLGTKELEEIVSKWGVNQFGQSVKPVVTITKKKNGIELELDYQEESVNTQDVASLEPVSDTEEESAY